MDKTEKEANQALKDFIRYSSSPWRIVWTNFAAGIFRGLGEVIGTSVFIAFIIWLLTLFGRMPLVGEYAQEVKTTVSGYINDTNYNDEFARLEVILKNIEKGLTENEAKKANE
ncbi:MAG TPA: hypothetical protein EYH38_10785 [Leucothrix sp.]|nr:hypothetical protein [Leucothrix sp.]